MAGIGVRAIKFCERLRLRFVEFTESLHINFEFENDTNYHVVIVGHDKLFQLPPGESNGQWVFKGFSAALVMKFPKGQWERIVLYSSELQEKTYYTSDLFKKQIEEYRKKHPENPWKKQRSQASVTQFQAGMKLEANDRQKHPLICVATITEVKDGQLLIHFDGYSNQYDYWCEPTSTSIHPVGWCEARGEEVQPPGDYSEVFDWSSYLDSTSSIAAPSHLFPKSMQKSTALTYTDEKGIPWSAGSGVKDYMGTMLMRSITWLTDYADKESNIYKLKELMNDPENTIELQFLKLYFIGPPGFGKTTTKERLTQEITNLSVEPSKRCSTYLAECTQCLAVVKPNQFGQKLTFMTGRSIDEEMQMLYAYTKERSKSSKAPQSATSHIPHQWSSSELELSDESSSQHSIKDPSQQQSSSNDKELTRESPRIAVLRSHSKLASSDIASIISNFRTTVGTGSYGKLEEMSGELLLNLVDIGGQPGFLEMLPLLSRGPGMFLAFFPLWKDLNAIYEVTYEREEDKITPYKVQFTITETLSQILSAINNCVGFNSPPLPEPLEELSRIAPVVTLVGTFKDKLELESKAEILIEKLSINFSQDEVELQTKAEILVVKLNKMFPQISKEEIEAELKRILKLLQAGEEEELIISAASGPLHDMQVELHHYLTSKPSDEVKEHVDNKLKRKEADLAKITESFEHILKHPQEGKFFSIDNASGKDSDLNPLREHLQHIFEVFLKNATLRIRPNQLFLGVILRKEYSTLSLYDCIQIGNALGMSKNEVSFTLWYLSECVGALVYCPDVKNAWFRQNIICNPQVIFDSISTLVVNPLVTINSNNVKHSKFTNSEIQNWKFKGQFSLAMIERCCTNESKDKVKKGLLIPTKSLIEFMKYSNLLAPIVVKDSESKEQIYFIPAILECAPHDTLINSPPTNIDTPSPIKITFKPGYMPTGLFCGMVSRLVSQGADGILGITWELTKSEEQLKSSIKRNLVCFCIDSAEHIVTLIAHVDCLEIRLIRQDRKISLYNLCSYVLSTVLFIMKEINKKILPIIGFDCQCGSKHDQLNKLCHFSEGVSPSFKCNSKNVRLAEYQECWIAKEFKAGGDVTLKALPYCLSPDELKLTFKWYKPETATVMSASNELTIKNVQPDDCYTYYSCKIYKNGEDFFSVHYYLKPAGSGAASYSDSLFVKVRDAIKDVCHEWYSLAVQLGISFKTRQEIREVHRFVEPCFRFMLQHWVDRTSPPPTKSDLIEALKSPVIDYKILVKNVDRIADEEFPNSASVYPLASEVQQHRNFDNVLTVDCDLKIIRELVWALRTKWNNFGLQLGISHSVIKAIENDYSNPGHCLTVLLEQWLQQVNPHPPPLHSFKH